MTDPLDLDQRILATQAWLNRIQQQARQAETNLQPLLNDAIAELSASLEELHIAAEEIHEQNAELLAAREALETERQRYQTLFEIAPDAYLVTNEQGIIQAANGAAETLFNLSRDQLVGNSLICYVASDDHELICEQLNVLDTPSKPLDTLNPPQSGFPPLPQLGQATFFLHDQEITLSPKGRSPVPASVSLSGNCDRQGRCVQLCWLFRDLRERKCAEATLRNMATELQMLYDQAPCGYHSLNAEGVVVRMNETELAMLGYTQQDVLGRLYSAFLTIESLRIMQESDERLRQQGWISDLSINLINKDGGILPVSLSATAVHDEEGQFVMSHSVVVDIRYRKELELSLVDSETRLSNVLDSAIAAISSFRVFVNRDWEYDYWSAGCERLFTYSLAELNSDKRFWLSHVVPEDLETVFIPLIDKFFAEQDATAEYRFRCKDGSIRWFSSTYASRQIEDDCWLVTTVNTDITDRKLAEEALQQQIGRMHLVTEMTRSIRETLDLDLILQRTVDQTRQVLQTDRVIIFRFQPDWKGLIVAESVASGWPTIFSTTIHDPCFKERYIEPYRRGRVTMISNVKTSGIKPCYAELLAHFRVKANLVVPILQRSVEHDDQLWGLLIAHHCSGPRQWTAETIELLQQLANQVGIALQQSELYSQTRRELKERQRTEARLKDSEARYRLLFDSNPNPMWVYDIETLEFLAVNQAAIDLYGYSREEFLGMTIGNLGPPSEMASLLQSQQTLTPGQTNLGTWRHLTKDASLIDVEILAHSLVLDERLVNLVLVKNITELIKAERKIREQAALIDVATDAIFVQGLDRRVRFWSQGAERLYGWTAAEALGQEAQKLICKNPSVCFDRECQITLDRGAWQGELEHVTKAGQDLVVASRWTLVRNEAAEPESILIVNTDITEKKRLETQFYRSQRLESLGTLASGVAHDLNNVLTPILAISQLMRLKPGELDEQTQEMMAMMEESAKRGAGMISQILTFARGSEGKAATVRVMPVLQEVASVIRQTFPKDITIRQKEAASDLRPVFADPTHLHQIFTNLCVNARDAMPEGGVLTLSADHCVVDDYMVRLIPEAQVGLYVSVTVADTGIGIPPELCDRIFEPFFTTKKVGQGSGLGLSTVLGIVKRYGGFLQVASEVGEGTRIQVFLPVAEGEFTSESSTEEMLLGQGEQVLIVDDDEAVLRTNQSLLESYHYRTLVARDGLEAIACYTEHQQSISLVLLDTMMPNMDGITAVQKLKAINPDAKIVAISGLASNRGYILAAGATEFLPKPYTVEELLSTVASLVRR